MVGPAQEEEPTPRSHRDAGPEDGSLATTEVMEEDRPAETRLEARGLAAAGRREAREDQVGRPAPEDQGVRAAALADLGGREVDRADQVALMAQVGLADLVDLAARVDRGGQVEDQADQVGQGDQDGQVEDLEGQAGQEGRAGQGRLEELAQAAEETTSLRSCGCSSRTKWSKEDGISGAI